MVLIGHDVDTYLLTFSSLLLLSFKFNTLEAQKQYFVLKLHCFNILVKSPGMNGNFAPTLGEVKTFLLHYLYELPWNRK